MASQGAQIPLGITDGIQLPAVQEGDALTGNAGHTFERMSGHSPAQSIDEVQQELLSLTLRHADIQKRIRSVRNALMSLVGVFGPQVLARQPQPPPQLSGSAIDVQPAMVSLCREILKTAERWLTLREILDAIRNRSPLVLANFKNPGVSVSNVLRSLRRQREVELELDVTGTRWRWAELSGND